MKTWRTRWHFLLYKFSCKKCRHLHLSEKRWETTELLGTFTVEFMWWHCDLFSSVLILRNTSPVLELDLEFFFLRNWAVFILFSFIWETGDFLQFKDVFYLPFVMNSKVCSHYSVLQNVKRTLKKLDASETSMGNFLLILLRNSLETLGQTTENWRIDEWMGGWKDRQNPTIV